MTVIVVVIVVQLDIANVPVIVKSIVTIVIMTVKRRDALLGFDTFKPFALVTVIISPCGYVLARAVCCSVAKAVMIVVCTLGEVPGMLTIMVRFVSR